MSNTNFYGNIVNIEQCVRIVKALKGYWFRGHSQTFGELTPSVFRENYATLKELSGEKIEFTIAEKFKQRSPTFTENLPGKEERLEWLFLMQHYGAPTRLLDWTENILVALFFAVANDENEDGELWVMYPDELNFASIEIKGIQLPVSKYVNFLASIPFHNNPAELKSELGIEKDINGPLAIYPPLNFDRMVNQMSAFTIHPEPSGKEYTIESVLADQQYLTRYKIPATSKKQIKMDLYSLGIRTSVLFPGLDSLSESIKFETLNRSMGLGEPPKLNN